MLHLKHKPQILDEVLGNSHIVNSLNQSLGKRAFAHSLFEGELGCGKSTFAQIMAKEFGADHNNIMDVNCFNFSGVNDIRYMIDNFLNTSSIFGNRKALILDEIHGLSVQAQQILLKELDNERLIERVIVIICTTTLNKVYPTLVSRFQHYRVLPLSDEHSKILIDRVCEKEGIKLSKYAKLSIIEKSSGIPRRILTAIPKLINLEDRNEINYLLDLNSIEVEEDILDLFKVILSNKSNWNNVKDRLEKLLKSKSPDSIRVGLLNLISGKLMSSYLKNEEEGKILCRCYKVLKDQYGFPEKANIISGIYEIYIIYKGL